MDISVVCRVRKKRQMDDKRPNDAVLSFQHETRLLYSVDAHNTVFSSQWSAVCAQAVYFLHTTMPSVPCLRLSDVSVICCFTYLQFPIQAWFSSSVQDHSYRVLHLQQFQK